MRKTCGARVDHSSRLDETVDAAARDARRPREPRLKFAENDVYHLSVGGKLRVEIVDVMALYPIPLFFFPEIQVILKSS